MADVRVENHGSIMLFHPLTDEAHDWIGEHIPEDAQRWCGAVVVEPRYALDIANGMQSDGLVVE